VLDETTADFAWALMMAAARRIVEGDAWMRAGDWPGWDLDQLLGADIYGKTLGIVGFGRIGQRVARRARGFEMCVAYSNSSRAPLEVERELNAKFLDLDQLLRESDFISIHVPLRKETRHLISESAFKKMKPTAYLINTARGPVVDEAALVEALEHKLIAGAALDVYEREPEVHPGLIGRTNVVLAPHTGSATIATRTKMAVMAATNAAAIAQGVRPPNAINADALGLAL
jgi:glyoxylate reductase